MSVRHNLLTIEERPLWSYADDHLRLRCRAPGSHFPVALTLMGLLVMANIVSAAAMLLAQG
jgi:hypothetical protein